MRTIRTKVYQFSELGKPAQDKAIIWFIKGLVQFQDWDENSPYEKAFKKMQQLQTPWFLEETLFHEHRGQLIADIEANEYEFKADGTRF
ncbi:MAG: hypothetical protein V4547_18810 [Bacteroidota bacterium]